MLLLFIMLLAQRSKIRKLSKSIETDSAQPERPAENEELEWQREKSLLQEHQTLEKHSRLSKLVESLAPDKNHPLSNAAYRLFFLAESIREQRQQLGNGISKLSVLDRRLARLGRTGAEHGGSSADAKEWLEKMKSSRQGITTELQTLRKAQGVLRTGLGDVLKIEQQARFNRLDAAQIEKSIDTIERLSTDLTQIPDDVLDIAKHAELEATELMAEAGEYLPSDTLQSIGKEQTTLDIFSSRRYRGEPTDTIAAAEAAIDALKTGPVPTGTSPAASQPAAPTPAPASAAVASPPAPPKPLAPIPKRTEPKSLLEITPEKPTVAEPTSKPEKPAPSEKKQSTPTSSSKGYTWKTPTSQASGATLKSESPRGETSGYQFQSSRLSAEPPSVPSEKPESAKDAALGDSYHFTPRSEVDSIVPDSPWMSPDTAPAEPKAHSLKNVASLVIFRSNDPEIWNTDTYRGANDRSIALQDIDGEATWISIKRTDTGEIMYAPIEHNTILKCHDDQTFGFNGTNEFFYGARHLGFFSEECAGEVETRFTYGGWGFGHLADGDSANTKQNCGWAGKSIADDTVIEIALYEKRPDGIGPGQIVV